MKNQVRFRINSHGLELFVPGTGFVPARAEEIQQVVENVTRDYPEYRN